ncbi:hypothetical protein R3P38DRAFT_2771036 [Favolaschia claudopus]|uniref:Uncharacterized protein n=1 Tax=Favolaschia claudopus TaxID=2862362 RepID=A0AAW0CDV4_9AGAR
MPTLPSPYNSPRGINRKTTFAELCWRTVSRILLALVPPPAEESVTEQYQREYASQLREEELLHAINLSMLDNHPTSHGGSSSLRIAYPPPQAVPSRLPFPAIKPAADIPPASKLRRSLTPTGWTLQRGSQTSLSKTPSRSISVKKAGSRSTKCFMVAYWNDTWALIPDPFVHKKDCVIMLRRTGIDCLDFDNMLTPYPDSPRRSRTHIRHNLPTEHSALRRRYRAQSSSVVDLLDDSSDDDVQIVASTKKGKKRALDTENAPPPRQRLRLSNNNNATAAHRRRHHPPLLPSGLRFFKAATMAEIEAGVKAGRTADGLWTIWRKRVGSSLV